MEADRQAQALLQEEQARVARQRAQVAIRDAIQAEALATTVRRHAVTAIAAAYGAADAVCDAITTGAPDLRRAAERAWVSQQREPYVSAASNASAALEAAREALKAHGASPPWWRPFQRMAWNQESRDLATEVAEAEVRHNKAGDRLRDKDRELATASPAQYAAGERAAKEHVTEAHRVYWRTVQEAQRAVNAAVEPSIAARDAWSGVGAARSAEAAYGAPSAVPGRSALDDRLRSEDLATIGSWISGERPIIDPSLRNRDLDNDNDLNSKPGSNYTS